MTTESRNVLPLLAAATTRIEMLALLKRADAAIGFALEHLEAFEMPEFFKDWQEDKDLSSWLDAAIRDGRLMVAGGSSTDA